MTYWRTGTRGKTCSTRCAPVSAMRRVVQEGADAATLAGEGHEEVVTARLAPRADEAASEDPALEVPAQLALDVPSDRRTFRIALVGFREPGLKRYYLLTGDRSFLVDAATTLRPWVNMRTGAPFPLRSGTDRSSR